MKSFLVLFLAILSLGGGAMSVRAEDAGPKLSWEFKIKVVNSRPSGEVFLVVDKTRYLIVPKARANYEELKKSEFQDYDVPADALAATYSWHAGFGDIMYVTRKGSTLEVFKREMDESETSKYPLKKIKTIAL